MEAINSKISESINSVVNEHFQPAISDYITALQKEFPDIDKSNALKIWNEMAPPTLNVSKFDRRKKAPRKKTGRVSAFNMFTRMERPAIVDEIKSSNPDIMITNHEGESRPDSKRLFKLVSAEMGRKWKSLSSDERKVYIDAANTENSKRDSDEEAPSQMTLRSQTQTQKDSEESSEDVESE